MKKTFCPECGPAEVSHFFSKSNLMGVLIVETLTKPLQPILRVVTRQFGGQIDTVSYFIFYILAFFRVIKLADLPSSLKDTDRAKCMWQAAKNLEIKIREIWVIGKPINVFLAKLPNGKRMVFEGLPRPGTDSEAMEWMDDKGIMKIKFHNTNLPVPEGRTCWTKNCALKIFNEIRKKGGTLVVKPTLGSRSRHTRVHIQTIGELLEAFKIAKQISPTVSVEEELRGAVYRVVLIGGRVAGVLRRDPPYVVGDGKMTIRELVIMANRDSRRHGPIFHEIPFNDEFEASIRVLNLNKNSIPEFGRRVIVGTKIGRSQGGTNVDVTDEINFENRRLFENVASFLRDPLVGIDFIIEDIGKTWREQMPCGVIELNTVPFLDLHMYPFEGKARDLSVMLWEEVLRS